jgi:tripartite-type tricarboxylate transporter receptor subunit TctC
MQASPRRPCRPRFEQLAAEARPGTPEELAAFVAGEIPKWQTMAKLAGITGE